jgi:hypothetical protein
MPTKMKRAQILFPEEQYQKLQQEAHARDCSVGELVREAVVNRYLTRTQEERLAAAKRLCAMKLPVSDWEEMEAQIEQMYVCEDMPEGPESGEGAGNGE